MGSTPLVFDLSTMPPGRMTFPRIVGGSYEGGSALSGVTLASDITGGGFLAVDYAEIQLSNTKRDRILAFSRLMVALQGGIRTCVVPLLTDYVAPAVDGLFSGVFSGSRYGNIGTTFSDGMTFSDGSEFSQPPITGFIAAAGNAGDGTVSLTLVGGRPLQGGEWFGVQHPTKSFRAYCVVDVDSQSVDGSGNITATVDIRPTLRDIVTNGMTVDWWRPRCLMRIKSGADATLDLSQFWYSTPSLAFVEAF